VLEVLEILTPERLKPEPNCLARFEGHKLKISFVLGGFGVSDSQCRHVAALLHHTPDNANLANKSRPTSLFIKTPKINIQSPLELSIRPAISEL
jgi:hypothetical protein